MQRLTIKELAPYLPYGLKVQLSDEGRFNLDSEYPNEHKFKSGLITELTISDGESIYGEFKVSDRYYFSFNELSEITLLLRPLSSIDLKWFKDNVDEALEDFRINCEPENNHFSVEVCEKVLGWSALSLEEYQLFYRYHVDIHGLIDRGLALPIDGKEVEGE